MTGSTALKKTSYLCVLAFSGLKNYLQNGVYELQRRRELLVAELLVRIIFHGCKEEKYIFEITKLQPVHAKSS